jgi:hypothetical protein
MQAEEIHCHHPHEAVPLIIQRVVVMGVMPRLIRIEGTMLAGKSSLANLLAEDLGAILVAGDYFSALGSAHGMSRYRDALRDALSTERWVVTDSVCLGEIAPEDQFGRGYRVYIKRLRAQLGARGWPYGFDIDDKEHAFPLEDGLERSIRLYHRQYRPHETANLIVNVPDQERGYCRREQAPLCRSNTVGTQLGTQTPPHDP